MIPSIRRLLMTLRVVAVALTAAGVALMGHSGISSVGAASSDNAPVASSMPAAAPAVSIPCDHNGSGAADEDSDKADSDVVTPAERDSDKGHDHDSDSGHDHDSDSDHDSDKDHDRDSDRDEDKSDEDNDHHHHLSCSASASAGGVGTTTTSVPTSTTTAAGSAGASAVKGVSATNTSPPIRVPATGSDLDFGAGLLLVTTGLGALAGSRRLHRRQRRR